MLKDFLESHSLLIIVFTLVASLVLLFYMPVLFGMVLIFTLLPLILGIFSFKRPIESLKKIILLFFLIGIISLPIISALIYENYRVNHPKLIISRNHPEVIKLTDEFKSIIDKDKLTDTQFVVGELENFIYQKIPYTYFVLFFPTADEITKRMTSDCRGRAFLGYAILKNLDYDAYITAGFAGGTHAWVRVYDKNASPSKIKESILADVGSQENKSFSELLTSPYVKKVWAVFNEDVIYWDSFLRQISIMFKSGFNVGNSAMTVITSLFFLWPISLSIIFLLVFKGVDEKEKYLFAVIGAIIAILLSGWQGISSLAVLPLPILLGAGIYLRLLNIIFKEKYSL